MKLANPFRASWALCVLALALVQALADGGAVDPTFQPPPLGFGVSHVAVQADGKVLIVGGMKPDGSAEPKGVVRLNADGSQDANFDIGSGIVGQNLLIPDVFTNVAATQFNALVSTPTGVLVGGLFEKVNGQPRTNLVRLLPAGGMDPGFTANADGLVQAIVPLAGGKTLVGGGFKKINGTARDGLARLNADGSVDSFNPNWGSFVPSVRAITVLADGKLLLGGGFLRFAAGLSEKLLLRLNADGTVDGTFTPPAAQFLTEASTGLLVQADGKIVVIDGFGQIAGNARKAIARLNADGMFDATWPGPGVGSLGFEGVNAIAPALDGPSTSAADLRPTKGRTRPASRG